MILDNKKQFANMGCYQDIDVIIALSGGHTPMMLLIGFIPHLQAQHRRFMEEQATYCCVTALS